MQGNVMQLHSANDQWTACVNMAFLRPQNYDSLHRIWNRSDLIWDPELWMRGLNVWDMTLAPNWSGAWLKNNLINKNLTT
jgi:hypothetical protein